MKFIGKSGIIWACAVAMLGGGRVVIGRSVAKHPLEEQKSWDLHLKRQQEMDRALPARRRHLQSEVDASDSNNDEAADDDTPYTVLHKKPKNHIPFAGGDTIHGIMIDAGSQGTRLHIYEWKKRFLLDEEDLLDVAHGLKLSFPTSNSRWTDKYTPGLDVFAYNKHPAKLEKELRKYLGLLLDFAKQVLKDKQNQWHTYPIYLKATGGLRTLPAHDRVRIMDSVRTLFHDTTFNPFAFEDERARVISGEEEAIYGWVAVNFAKGTLIDNSVGNGVAKNPKLTYGMLEMGGASTQIAYFENTRDLMANLFKLQLGGARHWNVYVHSYLYTGINGAWSRLNGLLYGEGTNVNPCLPLGSEMELSSWIHVDKDSHFYPRSAPESTPYTVTMINNETSFDFKSCSHNTYALLRKGTNQDWCDFEMDGNCAFAGIYQPKLPQTNNDLDEFVATSNFVDIFHFLELGDRADVFEIGEAAKKVCRLDWQNLRDYNSKLQNSISDDESLAQMCFRSVFVYQLLRNGWGFGDKYVMTAVDVINGQKVGWALGCMLYEINTLPWDFHPELLYRGPSWYLITCFVVLGTLVGAAIGFTIAMRTSKKFNKRVRQSVFFQQSALGHNRFVRKSLALPPLGEDERAELESLHDEAVASGPKYT